MTTREERFTIRFLDYLYDNYRGQRHIKRMAPSIGPIVWKIHQIAQPSLNRIRQVKFSYRNHTFKGRYSHHQGGQLEIVETIGRRDSRTVLRIRNLTEAMETDLRAVLDQFIGS